jgi:osmoprotectant transport system permease protein
VTQGPARVRSVALVNRPDEPVAARWRPAQGALAVLGAAVLLGLPFVRVAPNRLVSGEPLTLAAMPLGPSSVLAGLLTAVLALALLPSRRLVLWATVVACAGLLLGLPALAGRHAATVAQLQSPIARTALGGGFWLAWGLMGLILADALQALRASPWARLWVSAALLLPLAAWLSSGAADQLSLMKEYANRSEDFWLAIGRHGVIVAWAMGFTLSLGLPLGWAAHRIAPVRRALFPLLNLVQTVPSIALFGLLMAPLAWLASRWPTLASAGISGVGLAPGVIALTLYSLLPVVRGTLAGLSQVPSSVTQAARGLGMSDARIFWHAEVPLALPVVLSGVRTATIQAVGLAAVTALIGAGGLGSIMFEGLFSSAQDLVLLGVIPIIALGALVDAAFRGLIRLSRPLASPQATTA